MSQCVNNGGHGTYFSNGGTPGNGNVTPGMQMIQGCKGHTKDQCYKLIGYPPDFKSKKKLLNGAGNDDYMIMKEQNSERREAYGGLSGGPTFNYEFNTNVSSKGKQVVDQSLANTDEDECVEHLQGCTFTRDLYSQIWQNVEAKSRLWRHGRRCSSS
ncbi:hypothetical protein KY290_013969 [Solanum tuberosum]|uniref:Uncharacterized protein n=1 Tax=Solanum tuberosum TaxID=4113 RepID=A0ABQ7VNK0_SOLTU|nr:hypothetical protein KY290_013969 [Solanum tuberosum]